MFRGKAASVEQELGNHGCSRTVRSIPIRMRYLAVDVLPVLRSFGSVRQRYAIPNPTRPATARPTATPATCLQPLVLVVAGGGLVVAGGGWRVPGGRWLQAGEGGWTPAASHLLVVVEGWWVAGGRWLEVVESWRLVGGLAGGEVAGGRWLEVGGWLEEAGHVRTGSIGSVRGHRISDTSGSVSDTLRYAIKVLLKQPGK